MRPPTLDSRAKGTYRDDHGTPDWLLEVVRGMHAGKIHIDLASSFEDNERVGADVFYSVENPCPPAINIEGLVGRANIYCNPPGPAKKVKWFWDVWKDAVGNGLEGSFLVFSIDHLRLLSPSRYDDLYVCVIRKRLVFHGQTMTLSVGSALISTVRGPEDLGTWFYWPVVG
jgi:hypothetical protein